MGILSAAAAQSVARAIEVALPDRCTITRVTQAVGSDGGWTDTPATYASGIPCRVDKSGLTSRERDVAARLGSVNTYDLMLSMVSSRWPGGVPSTHASDTFTVTGDGAGVYEAAEPGGPVTDEMVRTIVCTRISS